MAPCPKPLVELGLDAVTCPSHAPRTKTKVSANIAGSRFSWRKGRLAVLVATLVALVLFGGAPPAADAHNVYNWGRVNCASSDMTVAAWMPTVRGNVFDSDPAKPVPWYRSRLYRWDGTRWVLLSTTSWRVKWNTYDLYWYEAGTNTPATKPWAWTVNSRGTYAVRQEVLVNHKDTTYWHPSQFGWTNTAGVNSDAVAYWGASYWCQV